MESDGIAPSTILLLVLGVPDFQVKFYCPFTIPAGNGQVRLVGFPVNNQRGAGAKIGLAILAWHYGVSSWIDVLVLDGNVAAEATIAGTRLSGMSYVTPNSQLNVRGGQTEEVSAHVSIITINGSITLQ
jgi:hypothetical protein